jgi:23S rRNA (cytosine1962-C5)-methyltransferase
VALILDYREDTAPVPAAWIDALAGTDGLRSVYAQHRPRRGAGGPPTLISGAAGTQFDVRELGVRYRIDLEASTTSTGLFLDQRETRRRLQGADRSGRTVLNTFAHTGSFSVAAALAGATTLTLDLSRHYLDWARDNLRANGIDPAEHDFVYGDALDWMDRFIKKGRTFDLVLVDPPSSSTGRGRGASRWSAERDLHALVERAARLCATGGTLFVSTNLRRMTWPAFLGQLARGLRSAGREGAIETQTVPLDHRSGPGDPPYLKAAWIQLEGAGAEGP